LAVLRNTRPPQPCCSGAILWPCWRMVDGCLPRLGMVGWWPSCDRVMVGRGRLGCGSGCLLSCVRVCVSCDCCPPSCCAPHPAPCGCCERPCMCPVSVWAVRPCGFCVTTFRPLRLLLRASYSSHFIGHFCAAALGSYPTRALPVEGGVVGWPVQLDVVSSMATASYRRLRHHVHDCLGCSNHPAPGLCGLLSVPLPTQRRAGLLAGVAGGSRSGSLRRC